MWKSYTYNDLYVFLLYRMNNWSRVLWTLLLLAAGVAHLFLPQFFIAYYPSYLPWPEQMVLLSGIVELLLATLLWIRAVERPTWLAISLLMAVYTLVHVYVITDYGTIQHPDPALPLWLAWVRLPMQGVLIGWAWREYRRRE